MVFTILSQLILSSQGCNLILACSIDSLVVAEVHSPVHISDKKLLGMHISHALAEVLHSLLVAQFDVI